MMWIAINLLITFKHYSSNYYGACTSSYSGAIQEQAAKGVLFVPTELEIEFSKKLRDAIPSLEKFAL